MALAFFIALIVLLTEIMLWFGYSQIASMAYVVYLNIFQKEKLANQSKIRRSILTVRQELARTSPQDEFANWARLKRKLDKKMNELERTTASFGYLKTSFEIKFTTFLWVASNGVQIIVMFYYFSTPVFYLPPGWFSPITWIFSLPYAPSVTIVLQWCNVKVQMYSPIVVAWIKTMLQWCSANIRTHSPIIIARMKLQVQKIYAFILEVKKSSQSSAVSEQTKSSVVDTTSGAN
ncbi:9101_t:CDS:2 [Cetraspora pellucida]|uniref:9101_t:CDS:1 n=1 Tax=Cetraspora pellucida TaxID=1433469 RepID=A0A9N9JH73_9GLOM|nr:9101_t:CDS:2 [Cetraspora pellucida]